MSDVHKQQRSTTGPSSRFRVYNVNPNSKTVDTNSWYKTKQTDRQTDRGGVSQYVAHVGPWVTQLLAGHFLL